MDFAKQKGGPRKGLPVNRRAFLAAFCSIPFSDGLNKAQPKAEAAQGLEAYFPTLAHQFVWRNWDLVPAERIARALHCSMERVHDLARTMALGPQRVPLKYWRLLRYKILRRNWSFVPYSQLTVLLQMSEAEIGVFLLEDAFYLGSLGPKPLCPEVRVEGLCGGAAIVLAHFQLPASAEPEEDRYHFIELLNRPVAPRTGEAREPTVALAPRLVYPYFARFGEVLDDEDFESYYPQQLLENIANMGLDSIWLEAVLRDVVKSSIFPEFGTRSAVQLSRLNWLIARAKKAGVKVYRYLNEPRGMQAGFFLRHPEIKGSPGRAGDGLFSMCTSAGPVQQFLVESTAALFAGAADLDGAFLITASENPTNCYSLTRHPQCPRCRLRKGAEVIGELVQFIAEGARRSSPHAHIIAWDWSWNIVEDDPQEEIIRHLPRTVTLMVDFERGTTISPGGVRSTVDEYSLSVAGPSPRAAAHIRQARARGMPAMAKIQVGNTWEIGLLPYIPVEQLVARKFEALRSSGVSGVMESWTLGSYPSENWDVARAFYSRQVPALDATLEKAAAALYGPSNAAQVVQAWQIFSDAFERYPFSNSLVYSSTIQNGPANPIYFRPTGKNPRIMNSFDNLEWTKPFGPEIVASVFEAMASEWQRGIDILKGLVGEVPAEKRDAAEKDFRISRAVFLYFKSISNQLRFYALRSHWRYDPSLLQQARVLVEEEIRVAAEFLEICRLDSRVGFEASLQYLYFPLDICEKITACQFMLRRQLSD